MQTIHGIKLLHICKSTCIRIVNGRKVTAVNIFFMLIMEHPFNIEYLLANESNFLFISNFALTISTNDVIMLRCIFHYFETIFHSLTKHLLKSDVNGIMQYMSNFAQG